MLYIEKADIHIKIESPYYNKTLFEAIGELSKIKTQPKYYVYCIVENEIEKDFDSVLWDNVDKLIEIDIKNVSGK